MSLGDEVASPENGAPAGANLSLTNPAAPTASDETTSQVQAVLNSEVCVSNSCASPLLWANCLVPDRNQRDAQPVKAEYRICQGMP
jgi:hypothetical protein